MKKDSISLQQAYDWYMKNQQALHTLFSEAKNQNELQHILHASYAEKDFVLHFLALYRLENIK